MKIVLASNNPGKLREFTRLLAPMDYEVIPQGQLNVPSAEEPFFTFFSDKAHRSSLIKGFKGVPLRLYTLFVKLISLSY